MERLSLVSVAELLPGCVYWAQAQPHSNWSMVVCLDSTRHGVWLQGGELSGPARDFYLIGRGE